MAKRNRRIKSNLSPETLEDRQLLTTAPGIEIDGNVAVIIGQATHDDVQLVLGDDTHHLNFAGNQYNFDADHVTEFHIAGGFGYNSIEVIGSNLDDIAEINGVRGTISSSKYHVETYQFASTTMDGGEGHDSIEVYGSYGNDTVQAYPGWAVLQSSTTTSTVENVENTRFYGVGGNDTANLYGSVESDWLSSVDNYVRLVTPSFETRAIGFDRVNGYGRGGQDSAVLFDSYDHDLFVSTSEYAWLRSPEKLAYTKGFEFIEAKATHGGNDDAHFYGSSDTHDTFMTAPGAAAFTNGVDYQHKAYGFDTHTGNAEGDGDRAVFFGWDANYAYSRSTTKGSLDGYGRKDDAIGFSEISLPNRPVVEFDASVDVVINWNNLFNDLLVANESHQNPGYASRSMAMMNVAIYDSTTLISGDANDTFFAYDQDLAESSGVDLDLVASHAAHKVLSSLYPDQQYMMDAFLADVATHHGQNAASANMGTEIADHILEARSYDNSQAGVDESYYDYQYNEAGYFQPDPYSPEVPVWGPQWSEVYTFAISSAVDYAPETTPPLTSVEYANSYNEVKELGSLDSTVRTADELEAGIFWAYDRVGMGTPMSLFADVLETIAVQQGNTLEENATLFAQASVSMADASVVAWYTKFSEEFWRPVTAIRQGDIDSNPLTEADADWTAIGAPDGGDDTLGFTPQFPTYISGHATFGGALFGAIEQFYDTDNIPFTLVSGELEILQGRPELQEAYGLDLQDATRSFDTLSEAMAENGRSRVYLGIHFDFDDTVGQEVGQNVAASVAHYFTVPSS